MKCIARSVGKANALIKTSVLLLGLLGVHFTLQAQSNPPIRIGSTLALTGPLSSTGIVHKLAGEIAVEDINMMKG